MSASRFFSPPSSPAAISNAEALCRHANAMLAEGKVTETEPLLRKAVEIAPNSSFILASLAHWHLAKQYYPAAALDLAFRATRLDPENASAHHALGLSAQQFGLGALAIGHLERALTQDPANTALRLALGRAMLQFGQWETGWRYHETRPLRTPALPYGKPVLEGVTEWAGQPLEGKIITLVGEAGFGEQIQHLRFVRNLLAMNPSQLYLDIDPSLRRLVMQALSGEHNASAVMQAPPDTAYATNYYLSTSSLGARFGVSSATLMAMPSFLRRAAPPAAGSNKAYRVGLAWRGNENSPNGIFRAIPLDQLLSALPQSDRLHLVSLQHGNHTQEELDLLSHHSAETPVQNDFDFYDTSQIITNLDLVIAADTAVAHLAGSQGCPVWLLNRATGAWRWGWKARTSPWYPSMRLFHQESLSNWEHPLQDVHDTLAEILQ